MAIPSSGIFRARQDKLTSFTMEGYYESLGLNGQRILPFYSEQNSLLGRGISGQSIYCNPPWLWAIACVERLRACQSRSPLDTRAIIVLPY